MEMRKEVVYSCGEEGKGLLGIKRMNDCTQWRFRGGKGGNTPNPLSFSPPPL